MRLGWTVLWVVVGSSCGETHDCKAFLAWQDEDGDGFGGRSEAVCRRSPGDGLIGVGGDCDDGDPAVKPGATEVCNGVDDDCDGVVDLGCDTGTATGTPTTEPGWVLPAASWERTGNWRTFSSPRGVDLTGDGVLDLVSGRGSESPADPLLTLGEVVALDGVDGSPLWTVPARQEVFGSAAFADLGGSAVADVVIGGRHGELMAIDGETGGLLWQWPEVGDPARQLGWYNFYSAALPGDLDGDGVPDLLLANGGDALAGPTEPRPPGRLALLSGADGSLIAWAPTPDGAETYCSPVLHEGGVLFGTGGETWPGGLWWAPLADLLAGDLSGAELWLDGGSKGAIAPPALGDLDGDGVEDVVVATFGGALVALDGAAGGELWRHDFPGHEAHGMPTLAELTGDGVPDVFAGFAEGTFPLYTAMTWLAVDGATGAELWRQTIGVYASSGSVAVDLDGNGLDAVIFGVNTGGLEGALAWQPWWFDPVARSAAPLADPFARGSVTAPWVGDLDGDGLLELVLATSDLDDAATWRMARYDLDQVAPLRVSWGAYMGTDHDSRFR